ncbi:MAG TPA: hypothetical protein VF846_03145 [Thermoanaerobaculia bacterium]|jgi:hypothetical protein
MPTLAITSRRPRTDLVHFASPELLVTSRHRRFSAEGGGRTLWEGRFPRRHVDAAGASRILRRFGRLDQCALAPVGEQWVAIRGGIIYLYAPGGALTKVGALRQCRIPLQVLSSGNAAIFGEYGSNPERRPLPVWRVDAHGAECVLELPAGRARHVHGVFEDPFTGRYWIATGDFENESWLISVDRDFRNPEYLGDGSQRFRAVALFFFEDSIVWLTDSQFVQNRVMRLDRATGRVDEGMPIPSPAWFGKVLTDGWLLAGCAWEHGEGCMRDGATLLASRNGIDWTELAFWKKDRWPAPWFRDGVIRFAPGEQHSDDFVLFGEGLRGLDGTMLRCALR